MKRSLFLPLVGLCLFSSSNARAQYTFTNLVDVNVLSTTSYFLPPSIDKGIVAYSAFGAVYASDGVTTTSLVRSGDLLPSGAATFLGFGETTIRNGNVGFLATYFGGYGFFTATLAGAVSPPLAVVSGYNPGEFSGLRDLALGESSATFTGTFPQGDQGIFNSQNGNLTTIAKTGDSMAAGVFTIPLTASRENDNIVFPAFYTPTGNSNDLQIGIFFSDGSPAVPRVLPETPSPVGNIRNFSAPSLRNNTVFFLASAGPGKNGIFAQTDTGVKDIVLEGQDSPIGKLANVGHFATNGTTVAFAGDTRVGGIQTGSSLLAITNGIIEKVIGWDEPLFGSTLRSFQIDDTGMDAEGNLAFLYRLNDGREGIALAKPGSLPQAIPEPGTLGLLALGLAGLITASAGGSRRRY